MLSRGDGSEVYLRALGEEPLAGGAESCHGLAPHSQHRAMPRGVKAGAIQRLKTMLAKKSEFFGCLGQLSQSNMLECECGMGPHDAVNCWFGCEAT